MSALFSEYAAQVVLVIAASLRPEDRGAAEDLAQDVWLGLWEQVVSGVPVISPADRLGAMARRRVGEFYRSGGLDLDAVAFEAVAA